jgi:hypothetical protein
VRRAGRASHGRRSPRLSTTNSIEHKGLPYDLASRRLFGVPVVTTNAQASSGVGHVLATGAVALDTDTRDADA